MFCKNENCSKLLRAFKFKVTVILLEVVVLLF